MRLKSSFCIGTITLLLASGSLWSQSLGTRSHVLQSFRNHPASVRGRAATSVRTLAAFPSVHNFATTDFPGSSDTLALDRNPASGMLVGIFDYDGGHQGQQGFTLKGATYKLYNVPGALQTLSLGIGSLNQITGAYIDSSGTAHGSWIMLE